ncbi:ROK family transcriptional regulator [Cryobacterium sp. MLB-32]|uniref:ROK family protein n=1 Tax=Cryobacterium sp. MLB-32 TaxID=1529318 RepID=UPI0004E6B08D|nr:ROK family protein [Cryobacterium sp. MLB-32]KFF58573.1 ROK family transcriptional regulator [Cryobacterium sp. MLB-32]
MPPSPPSPLGPGAPVFAFDIGGTDIKCALVDGDGCLLGVRRVATATSHDASADAVLNQVTQLAADLTHDFPDVTPLAVGLISPGIIDDEMGLVRRAVNLNWTMVPFRRRATELLHMPASFTHDARAAGAAEFALGAARGFTDVVVIVIGTGLSCSLFLGGRPHTAGGLAGELGHSIVDPTGLPCACGSRGCLETVASAGAISRRYASLTGTSPAGARAVIARVEAGDAVALRVWTDALDALALTISQLAAVLAPEAIVIGGGLAQAGPALFDPLRERVNSLLSFHRPPAIVPALLGESAGLLGAALNARSLLKALADD